MQKCRKTSSVSSGGRWIQILASFIRSRRWSRVSKPERSRVGQGLVENRVLPLTFPTRESSCMLTVGLV